MIRHLTSIVLVAVVGCGGSSSSNKKPLIDGPGNKIIDAPVDVGMFDFGCGGGSACALNKACCAMTGAMTTFSCVDPGSCPAGDKILCDGPQDCSGGTPVCCGVEVPSGGSFPQCNLMSLGTSCTAAADCKYKLALNCTDTDKVQLCHVAADCTDPSENKCCTFGGQSGSLTFCTDSTTAGLAGATCHP